MCSSQRSKYKRACLPLTSWAVTELARKFSSSLFTNVRFRAKLLLIFSMWFEFPLGSTVNNNGGEVIMRLWLFFHSPSSWKDFSALDAAPFSEKGEIGFVSVSASPRSVPKFSMNFLLAVDAASETTNWDGLSPGKGVSRLRSRCTGALVDGTQSADSSFRIMPLSPRLLVPQAGWQKQVKPSQSQDPWDMSVGATIQYSRRLR